MADWWQSYPNVYASLSPVYQELPREQIEQVIEGVFGPGTTLELAEGFFDGIGQALSGVGNTVAHVAAQAAPVLAKAAPGVVSGATTGAALGPWGALAGGLIGGLTSALGSSGGHAAGPPTAAPGTAAAPPTAAPVGVPALFGAGAGSTGTVGQLLAALGSSTVQSALKSMLMGPAGNPTVPTATGAAVPVAAVGNLLSLLAGRASAEWEASNPYAGEDYLEGVLDPSVDTTSPEVRSAWLFGQLAPPTAATEPEQIDESWLDDMYDEMEATFYDGP